MKNLCVLLALCCVMTIGFNSCSTTSPENPDAQQLTVAELNTSIGYSWFQAEAGKYPADPVKVQKIADAFKANHQKMYVFVRPTCSCTGTQYTFPHTLQVLKLAGVPDSMITVYSMQSSATKHPMMSQFSIGGLPSFYITKGESTVYIMQTLNEKLYANSPNQANTEAGTRTVEDMILEGFMQ